MAMKGFEELLIKDQAEAVMLVQQAIVDGINAKLRANLSLTKEQLAFLARNFHRKDCEWAIYAWRVGDQASQWTRVFHNGKIWRANRDSFNIEPCKRNIWYWTEVES